MRQSWFGWVIFLCVIIGMMGATRASAEVKKPNIVIIFIDDLGYGGIEPFGSTRNKTPHLNRMAEEGLKMTSFYSTSPVCTPSRASLMTGSYPRRVSLDTGSWAGVLFPKDSHGLNPDEITIAEVLKDVGYATGCFGKWHLGDQPEFLPTAQGFDTYFGIPYSNDMWPLHGPSKSWKVKPCPLPVMRDTEVLDIVKNMDDQALLAKRFTDEAVAFMKTNKDKPFFVYLPHAFVHFPHKASEPFMKQAEGNARRAQVEEVDWSVGEILKTVRELGIEEKTLVVFTSDNGGAQGFLSKPFRGGKGNTWEGGMREPTIAWWPGTIPAGSETDEVASTMDLLPTAAALSGGTVPDDRVIDGKDISALLKSPKTATSPHEAFFYYSRSRLEAVRMGVWKLRRGKLYHLKDDIAERRDVRSEHPEVAKRLEKRMAAFRAELDDPKNRRPVGKVENPQYLVPLDGSDSAD